MDWRSLIRNRWVWVAGGVGAVAGLVTLYRRRGTGGGSTGGGPTGGGSLGGFADTTSTDVASQLGQREERWQDMFDAFTENILDKLANLPPGPEAPTTPTTPGNAGINPSGPPPPTGSFPKPQAPSGPVQTYVPVPMPVSLPPTELPSVTPPRTKSSGGGTTAAKAGKTASRSGPSSLPQPRTPAPVTKKKKPLTTPARSAPKFL